MTAGRAPALPGSGEFRHAVRFRGYRVAPAPSTLGSHLRCYTWGNVRQLEKAHREFLAELARRARLLPGADVLAFIDIDSMQKRVYGYKKQGARFGPSERAA
jgi:hypothetical protein